jgi:ferric-dicitrate binding protein FerR (iron transport regulator)
MINKEEFTSLYRKYIDGHITPEEYRLLEEYQDGMELAEFDSNDIPIDKVALRNRIWQRLNNSRQQQKVRWIGNAYRVSAAACFLLVISLLWWRTQHNEIPAAKHLVAQVKHPAIKPGGNKAYLTMANGTIIQLTGAKNGELATQAGFRISKAKNGLITYQQLADNGNAQNITNAYNTITTPRGGQYQIILSDGTQVWLNSASSLRYPVSFTGNTRQVELTGEAYFEVAKNAHMPFHVQAGAATVQVLGTHFNINSYPDNAEVVTTLLEGSVRMQKGTATSMLIPGQQGITANNQNNIQVQKADITEVMGWKNGYFVFHDENITNIMKQVSRWYDIDVEYDGDVKDREFGGTVSRYKDVTELLNNMELTQAIHYKIIGRRVIIMR